MSNPKVHICGHPSIHVPDDDCSECIRELNQFKDEVHENYYTKTDSDARYYTKEETYTKTETDGLLDDKQDTLTAGANITIDENNVISASGGGGGSMTKAEILAALGYKETTLSMTATDGTTVTETILVKI